MPATRDPAASISKRSLFDVFQGHYAAELLLYLRRAGVLESWRQPQTPAALARQTGIAAMDLRLILEFLTATTNVIERDVRGRYAVVNVAYGDLAFQLEKFIGAYGPCIREFGRATLDQKALADAFVEGTKNRTAPAVDLIRDAGLHCIVDLGCGPASLLVQLAAVDSQFRGFGVDATKVMCRVARDAVRERGLERRIKIVHADASDIGKPLSRHLRDIDGVHCSSFLNEFFGSGRDPVAVLKRLRQLLPGRPLFVVDYYGELGHRRTSSLQHPVTLLQDVAQVASGQGVPPPDMQAWRRIYRRAGCRLIRAMDFETSHLRWFIHEVRL